MQQTIREVAINLRGAVSAFGQWADALESTLAGALTLGNYSQRDPDYRNEFFAGGLAFETDGCYVCTAADILASAGYEDTPPQVAAKLRAAGCFSGANLSSPDLIPEAYPRVEYHGPVYVGRDGPLRWHHGDADMARVWAELEQGPVIAEVNFAWPTQYFNQHFVVLVEPTMDRADVWIHDPWDGSRVRLLQKYAGESWDLARTIYGLRLLRPLEE